MSIRKHVAKPIPLSDLNIGERYRIHIRTLFSDDIVDATLVNLEGTGEDQKAFFTDFGFVRVMNPDQENFLSHLLTAGINKRMVMSLDIYKVHDPSLATNEQIVNSVLKLRQRLPEDVLTIQGDYLGFGNNMNTLHSTGVPIKKQHIGDMIEENIKRNRKAASRKIKIDSKGGKRKQRKTNRRKTQNKRK